MGPFSFGGNSEHEGRGIWLKCGVLLEKEDGKKSIKFDVVPVGSD
jgi:hypothetical protein